jgi:hypothetical protein
VPTPQYINPLEEESTEHNFHEPFDGSVMMVPENLLAFVDEVK